MEEKLEMLAEEIKLASKVRENAYIKYCNYSVGSCLTTKSGKRYLGCNVQNHGIQSICSERCAFCKAISEGEKEFDHIMIVGGPGGKEAEKTLPCGYCRQFMSEFVDKSFKVYTSYGDTIEEYTMEELLPHSFDL